MQPASGWQAILNVRWAWPCAWRNNGEMGSGIGGDTFAWDSWRYAPVEADMSLGPSVDKPSAWASSVRGVESSVETLLAIHTEQFVGFPLRFLRRDRPLHGAEDLVATDDIGRIHIFELKKGSISEQAASQLEYYLFRYLFQNPDAFVGRVHRARWIRGGTSYLRRQCRRTHASVEGAGRGPDMTSTFFTGAEEAPGLSMGPGVRRKSNCHFSILPYCQL